MGKRARTRRAYDSTLRQAQAGQTRQHILQAASRVFAERGYAGATMQLIAGEAGVGVQTIYAIFKNKPRVLVALFNASSSARGEERVPVTERAGPQAVGRERDQRRQLQMFAEIVADNLSGAAPVWEIMVDAARTEPEIGRIIRVLSSQRLEHMMMFVDQLAANGRFRANMDAERARDIVWTLTSPEVFLLMTRDRSWPKEAYAAWLADALTSALVA